MEGPVAYAGVTGRGEVAELLEGLVAAVATGAVVAGLFTASSEG